MPRGVPKSGKRKARKTTGSSKVKPFPTKYKGAKVKVGRTSAYSSKTQLQQKAGQAVTKANRRSARANRLVKSGMTKKSVISRGAAKVYKASAKSQRKKASKLMTRSKKAPY